MNNINYTFFEEYKRLDKLCSEIYSAQNGVTHYIDDMQSVSYSNYRNIPNWTTDLNQLKRLRHLRNHLAHTEGAFDDNVCTQNDTVYIPPKSVKTAFATMSIVTILVVIAILCGVVSLIL